MELTQLSSDQLSLLHAELTAKYEAIRGEGLSLDLTRGKPSPEQLDLSNELDGILAGFYLLQDGTDVRNYGGILGIPEARALGATILQLDPAEVMAGGNSSLTLMYLYIDFMHHYADKPWQQEGANAGATIKFLCPVPGYDRHFTICERFGIEMITVPFVEGGPDMDQIEAMVGSDPLIKGIWCVPKYSNPTGHTYSDETVARMAKLPKLAGDNFRVMWDNAYTVHHLTDKPDQLADIMALARNEGTTDNIVMLASTSKITFAGAGVAFLGASAGNLAKFEKFLSASVIGFDKINQLRHARFLKDEEAVTAHMDKHKAILKPKFDMVEEVLDENLGGKGIATWTRPAGGYFVSLDTLPGLARQVVRLAADVGVKLTPAGATFPYGIDPTDTNIRIAPTFPTGAQLKRALEVLVLCVQLASVNHLTEG
ncbi:MAG TPA: aminotransferase class I/II-fold pyridoxal phosphate-dependent enzyme [Pseudomonadales bacterium]|nr:aminotransferase class I/II-fold pyridoxal phosphate-dependent enzyme [Pseudomonadales bacterium]